VGVLYRENQANLKINLPNNQNDTLYIIVENMGRLNFGNDTLDSKVCYFFYAIFFYLIKKLRNLKATSIKI
jgi:hypothetical protein